MLEVREIKYSEGSNSIQIYKIKNRKRVIVRHIGTARSGQKLRDLIVLTNDFIEKICKHLLLFSHPLKRVQQSIYQ